MRLSHLMTWSVLGGLALAGCSANEIRIPAKEEYAREFVKNFGAAHPTQDWNTASRQSVTVSSTLPTSVKIYADVDGKTYLFADYSDVRGQRTLTFDLPKGIEEIAIRGGGKYIRTKVGSTVSLDSPASRVNNHEFINNKYPEIITVDEDYFYMSPETVRSFTKVLPESDGSEKWTVTNADGTVSSSTGKENIFNPSITADFEFVSTGKPFKFYPMYWQTNSWHILGVYWYDENGNMVKQGIYKTKSGVIKVINESDYEEPTYIYPVDGKISEPCETTGWIKPAAAPKVGDTCKHGHTISKVTKQHPDWNETSDDQYDIEHTIYTDEPVVIDTRPDHMSDANGWGASSTASQYAASKGISINLPKGTIFGFYLSIYSKNDISEGQTQEEFDEPDYACYSQGDLNYTRPDGFWNTNAKANRNNALTEEAAATGWPMTFSGTPESYQGTPVPSARKHCTSSYFKVDGKTFFGFEDWRSSSCDMNDVVFMIDTEDETTTIDIEKVETYPWIVAVEDLGDIQDVSDIDFNDVVFAVDHVAGSGTFDVTVLAGGGTMPAKIFYKGTEINGAGEGQVLKSGPYTPPFNHVNEWLGERDHSQVVHAGEWDASKLCTVTVTIPEGDEFSISSDTPVKDGAIGGFTVHVDRTSKNLDTTTEIIAPVANGEPPMMIVCPYSWRWPMEGVSIRDAYRGTQGNQSFQDWVENVFRNTTYDRYWYASPTKGLTVDHTGWPTR